MTVLFLSPRSAYKVLVVSPELECKTERPHPAMFAMVKGYRMAEVSPQSYPAGQKILDSPAKVDVGTGLGMQSVVVPIRG